MAITANWRVPTVARVSTNLLSEKMPSAKRFISFASFQTLHLIHNGTMETQLPSRTNHRHEGSLSKNAKASHAGDPMNNHLKSSLVACGYR